jgi:hypothetical protein
MFSEPVGECDDHYDWCISCCGVRDLKTLHFCTMDCVSLSDVGQFILLFKSLWMVLMQFVQVDCHYILLFAGCKGCMSYAFFPHIGIGFIIDHRCNGNVTMKVIIVLYNMNISHIHGTTDDIYSILIPRVLKIGPDWWKTW